MTFFEALQLAVALTIGWFLAVALIILFVISATQGRDSAPEDSDDRPVS